MSKLSSTAKTLDIIFKVFQILFCVVAVTFLVCLFIIIAGFIFDLAPEQIGTNYDLLDIGYLELQLADDFVPNTDLILVHTAVILLFGFICAFIARLAIRQVRKMLQPMAQGEPFHSIVSTSLKKLSVFTLIYGVVLNLSNLTHHLILTKAYRLADLVTSEKIVTVSFQYKVELTFLIVWALLLLLSYVFRYGEELQQLSDETL